MINPNNWLHWPQPCVHFLICRNTFTFHILYKMCHGKHRALGGHLDGLTQSITFLSGSLSTNLACLLTRLPRVFNGGQRRVEACFNGRVFSLSGLADRV